MTGGDTGSTDGESNGGGSERDGSGGGAGAEDGTDGVSTAELVVMVASAAVTVALFGFALWHAVAGVGVVAPAVDVTGSQTAPDGSVIYEIELRNPGDVGLVSATVSVECTQPPTEVDFENVPAQGRRSGSVRCPPGTTDPTMTVSDWVVE